MSLFNFGKKKEEKEDNSCICNCACSANEVSENTNECCGKTVNGICCIKVLGAGCKSCHEMYENTKQAVNNIGLNIEVEYITDMRKNMESGVMSMPALVINEKVVSQGKVLKETDITKFLNKQIV